MTVKLNEETEIFLPNIGWVSAEKYAQSNTVCPHYEKERTLCLVRMRKHKPKWVKGMRTAMILIDVNPARKHTCSGKPKFPDYLACLVFQGEKV